MGVGLICSIWYQASCLEITSFTTGMARMLLRVGDKVGYECSTGSQYMLDVAVQDHRASLLALEAVEMRLTEISRTTWTKYFYGN
jgi:hypothetical protein